MKIRNLEPVLHQILIEIHEKEAYFDQLIQPIHRDYKLSAKNLLRYLVLRSHDLRKYHGDLSDLGVSSIRSAEGYVYSNLYNVVKNLNLIQGKPFQIADTIEIIGYTKSMKLLRKHANALFNKSREANFTEIMVTLPTEAAHDKELLRDMARNGMEIARINLSHDNTLIWKKMVDNIREVSAESGQRIKIYMDLSGPKLRTADVELFSKKGKRKNFIPLLVGDHLILTKRETLGKRCIYSNDNRVLEHAEIGVLLPEVIDDARIGDAIYFDDGMIRSRVIDKNETDLELLITECFKTRLGAHKGINLPQTKLNLPALTFKDVELLPFVCEHADLLGYSFVRTAKDVAYLYRELDKLHATNIGVVLKIENKEAFDNLPSILLKGMERPKLGVMIARGDLAVELGFERISEVQNQILWFCEAAHIPVIWATQVLENLAKSGIPTRAEITDAAQAVQAECVMLNKGPYINDAIKLLKDILTRMKGHVFKKKNELRALNVAKAFIRRIKG
ncbi:MAG: hypothetical protein KDC56_03670 [Flavobacteriaceae bacterium]|nr:hypothetical protein [Flavobacteriaceae bacterium]